MSETPRTPPDLTNCDREPIHIPGSIQPHGFMFVLDPVKLTVLNCSANAEQFLGLPPAEILGRPVTDFFAGRQRARLEVGLRDPSVEDNPLYLATLVTSFEAFHAIAHRRLGRTILELEATSSGEQLGFREFYPLIRSFPASLHDAVDVNELAFRAARQVRLVTEFDRVLIYRFEPDWTGVVIAEDGNGRLASLANHRFPASDIPRQARELYRLNRLRQIPDSEYQAVALLGLESGDRSPIDLTYSSLRSVSPVHLEYMRNMGTAASMSISILREGQLWGLISCHHSEAKAVPFEVRTACDLLGQLLALEIAVTQGRIALAERLRLKATHMGLLNRMIEEQNFTDALVKHPDELLAVANAQGAAVLFGETCHLIGVAPEEREVRKLAVWLGSEGQSEVYETASLSRVYAQGEQLTDVAAGLLAISISKLRNSYVMWFRPEIIRTLQWAGEPRKAVGPDERISPRKSFAAWEEQVRGWSMPWSIAELESAAELRSAIIGTVLRRAEELAELNAELKRSNQELEAFSYTVSHDLKAPFRHISGYAELLREGDVAQLSPVGEQYAENIIESAHFGGLLVDNLLSFSQIGHSALNLTTVDMNELVRTVRTALESEQGGKRQLSWQVGELPKVWGDAILLRQVVRNLLSNALKYTRSRELAVIEIAWETAETETVFRVRDNGVGFDMTYSDKLFGVFQRLHKMEDFEGTGIGLAIVRRIVSRHGGRTWAMSAPQQGATFYFSIPESPGASG